MDRDEDLLDVGHGLPSFLVFVARAVRAISP
jgi:hypothetical protein